jgi:protein phosphatase
MTERKTYYYCNVEGNTDVGCKRKANEDWLDTFECQNGLVAVVCDGMGGHVGGQIASHTAVDAIRKFLTSSYFESPAEAIVAACDNANKAILQRAVEQPELTGMGSTCVMLIVRNGKVYIGSVGDSRVYLVRSKQIRQLTKDQSYVQMLVDMGQITSEEAEHHPRKNEIMNALGLPSMKPATVLESAISPEAGDCFVLCSDGLSGMVSDHDICKVVSNQAQMSQSKRVAELINRARNNGGLDNITCQIVEFSITPPSSEKAAEETTNVLRRGPVLGVAILALLLIVAGIVYLLRSNSQAESNGKDDSLISEIESVENSFNYQHPQSIVYIPGGDALTIEVNSTYNSIELRTPNSDKPVVITKPVSIDQLKILPDKGLKKTQEDQRITVQFSNKGFFEECIVVQFHYATNDVDSIYNYIFPVDAPSADPSDDKAASPSTPEQPKNRRVANPSGAVGAATKTIGNFAKPDSSQTAAPDKPKPHPAEVTINLADGKDQTTLTIIQDEAGSHTNTSSEIYVNDPLNLGALSPASGWFQVSGSGSGKWNLAIENSKVPTQNKRIELPTTNGGKLVILIK